MRCASALLTASGFSIITWTCRGAAASTMAGWSRVLVNEATASGFARSSICARSVNSAVVGQLVALGVASQQRRVRLEDADDLHVCGPARRRNR